MRPASLVAWRCASEKYAGTVMTACSIGSPRCASARSLSARSTCAETSGGVTVRSPTRIRTTSAAGSTANGNRPSSPSTSA